MNNIEIIKKFLEDDKRLEALEFCTLFNLEEALVANNFEVDWGDFDTNGWVYDFWLHIKKEGKKYTVFGSWHYGGYKIRKDE